MGSFRSVGKLVCEMVPLSSVNVAVRETGIDR